MAKHFNPQIDVLNEKALEISREAKAKRAVALEYEEKVRIAQEHADNYNGMADDLAAKAAEWEQAAKLLEEYKEPPVPVEGSGGPVWAETSAPLAWPEGPPL